jgi:curved DNA-binding protein CbpA
MECNKDEAIKARDIAVKKLENNDFEGARKFLEKSKRLYPDIENITHLQAVCDVQMAAQIRLFMTEKDWYSILQVEKIADNVTIKKQYRKLALVLHPDKNKYPGAEAAFKLVGEANMVLSDKGKRSIYDMKIRANVKPPAHAPTQRNTSAKKQQPKTNNSFPNAPNRNQHPAKPNQPNTSFWTCCPFCSVKYQYLREYVNRALRCQSCSKAFIAHDIGGSNGRQPVKPLKQQASKLQQQGPSKVDPKPYFKPPDVKPSQQNVRRDLPASIKADPVLPNESDNLKNTSKKRGRKVDESSESFSTSSGESEDVVEESGPYSASNSKKRSSRQKHQVSYSENVNGNDFISSLKRPRVSKKQEMENKSGNANGEKVKPESVSHPEEKVNQAAKEEKCSADNDLGSLVYECPDPEFHDFDKEKDETEFSAGQIWACYDTVDGMPRFYAEVKKVFSHKFKLLIHWLEAEPDAEDEREWVNEGLPVACGKFERGDSEEISDRPMFSHRVNFEKGKSGRRITYRIFPQKAEIWAIYKNWDVKWSSDPENHKVFELEIVEVISNFNDSEGDGIRVCYLEKVKGFLSLFKNAEISSFLILPSEFFRFSHKIPSFKMNGTERHGVPNGSFELDPASLPPYFINQMKNETEDVNSKVNGLTTRMKDNRQKVSFEVRRSPRESKANSKNLNLGNSTQNVPEESFYNFCSEKKFQLGQIWASYKDGLPNKYAQIMKINYPTLQVQFVEPVTENQPGYCGVFKLQTGKEVLNADCFSHMVSSRPITTKAFEVYPKKGEIWAVHQNCTVDVPGSGLKNSEYDVVEVVNDTARATEVSALTKVAGYKSVYKNPRRDILVILRAEYRRFSHQIPAFQLTEQESGILKGYWELDPAAIPGIKDKTKSKSDTEKMCSPKKPDSRFEKAGLRRSPRESKTIIRLSNGTEENSSSCLAAEKICIDVDPRPSKLSEELFHDFSQDKSPAKFESSQVWAMYKNGLPKTYAQIKKIEFGKFGLHVQLLESHTLKESSCGFFKIHNSKIQTLHPPESFSHLVKARVINQGIFEIYPRKGEIWAMFKTWKATSSNQEKCEYEIVEALEDTDQFTKVSSLIRVSGFKSVFKSMRRQRSASDFLVIPREEFGRFSHQIPFFKLNGEDNGRLRGCWELDPAAVPGNI